MKIIKDRDVVPVISLVILREDDPGKVLLGVRSATATSDRHPNVLSSPTMRIPAEVMVAAITEAAGEQPEPGLGEIIAFGPTSSRPFGCRLSLSSTGAFLAETLMTRKLGVAEQLVSGSISGTVSATAVAFDLVHDPATELAEPTFMLSFTVAVRCGADLFPDATSSYRRLYWVDTTRVADAVDRRDALALMPEADLEVCLHGLCVRSAAAVLEHGASASATPVAAR